MKSKITDDVISNVLISALVVMLGIVVVFELNSAIEVHDKAQADIARIVTGNSLKHTDKN